jgi:hypothetical protein
VSAPDRTRLAGDVLDQCRRRVQQDLHGHRGCTGDPLYATRRLLHTGADLVTGTEAARLRVPFAADEHVQVEATWGIYQRMIAAYREPDRRKGREMQRLIDLLSHGVPAALREIITLKPNPAPPTVDVLAYFDRPGTSTGPTEALNRRLEHMRGGALAFRDLINYIARSLLETGGFGPQLHPQSRQRRDRKGDAKPCSRSRRRVNVLWATLRGRVPLGGASTAQCTRGLTSGLSIMQRRRSHMRVV